MNDLQGRMRCHACGQRVTHGLSVCPYCGHNPVRFHTRWRMTFISVLLGVVMGFVLFPLAPHPQAVSLTLNVSETPHSVAIARPSFTPTATTTPLPTATSTHTATPAPPSPTATHTAVKAASSTATPTSTASATVRPTVEPPRLISPKDQAEFGGEDTEIILQWEGSLQEGQQFAVTVRYIGKSDETKTVGSWLREMRWRVPNAEVYRNISRALRAVKWDVTIIDASGNAVSLPSESHIFIWSP